MLSLSPLSLSEGGGGGAEELGPMGGASPVSPLPPPPPGPRRNPDTSIMVDQITHSHV